MRALIAPIARRVRLMVSRAVVQLINDGAKMQELQVLLLSDELRARVERFQNYGFTSVPLAGAEALVVSVGGSRSHPVAVAVDDRRYRKRDLQPGETAIYTDEGDYVLLKRGRVVEVKAGTKVLIDAPLAECTGDLHVMGNITCDHDISDATGSMQTMRDQYNQHTHGATPAPTPGMT